MAWPVLRVPARLAVRRSWHRARQTPSRTSTRWALGVPSASKDTPIDRGSLTSSQMSIDSSNRAALGLIHDRPSA